AGKWPQGKGLAGEHDGLLELFTLRDVDLRQPIERRVRFWVAPERGQILENGGVEPAVLPVKGSEPRVGGRQVGSKLERGLVLGEGTLLIASQPVGIGQPGMRSGLLRIEPDGGREALRRLLILLLSKIERAQPILSGRVARVQRDGRPVGGDRKARLVVTF